jgi:simple sugar transport system ATP-binding protein
MNAVEMRGITKVYREGNFTANRKVSLELRAAEILCLAGENGAGKTTLMRILYGLTPPTEGEIFIKGRRVHIDSPLSAGKLGIGMVHQHFMLIPEFTVAQNVVLGIEPVKGGVFYDTPRANAGVNEVIRRHHFSLEAAAPVQSLTVGQMQQVEIVKMLYREADILILDEPTAVLTEQEIAALFKTLRTLAEAGKSLILITHKLREIKQISHRVAIMRRGEMIGAFSTADIDEYEISRLMVGRGVEIQKSRAPSPAPAGPALISFEDVGVVRRRQKRPLLEGVSFTAHGGEILAFAGVGGNGLGVLEAVLGGFLPISSGRIRYRGQDISRLKTAGLRERGLAYVPADRLDLGSAQEASALENMIIHRRGSLSRRGFLDTRATAAFAGDLFERYDIAGNIRLRLGSFSGGNIQKLILAREIDQYRDYIVFSEPARGLDVAAARYVYRQMAALRDKGAAVILISSNLDEILANADRVLVFYRGAVAAEIRDIGYANAEEESALKEKIGAYMTGLNEEPRLTNQRGGGNG